jgi:hypothetical protein
MNLVQSLRHKDKYEDDILPSSSEPCAVDGRRAEETETEETTHDAADGDAYNEAHACAY